MINDKQKTLQLLSILYSEIDNQEIKKQLGRRFLDVVKRTDIFIELQELINQVVIYNDTGQRIIAKSEAARQNAGNGIENGLQSLDGLKEAIINVQTEVKKTHMELESIIPKSSDVSMLMEKDERRIIVFYDTLISILTYILATHYGMQTLSNVYYKKDMSLLSKIKLVEENLFPKINEKSRGYSWWAIKSAEFKLFDMGQYYGYGISIFDEKKDIKNMLMQFESNMGGLRKISPNLYVATDSSPTSNNKLIMVGRGYIVGHDVLEASFLLDGNVITKPSVDALEYAALDDMDIHEALTDCLGTKNYCITPEALVEMLNRRQISEKTEKRLANKQCIFCGKEVKDGKPYCGDHFHVN